MTVTDPYLEKVARIVADHGVCIQGVFGTEEEPGSFSYTVGMTPLGLPELLVDGLGYDMSARLLNALVEVQRADGAPLAGEVALPGWSVPFRVTDPVDPEAAEAFVALSLYPHPMLVEVRQVLWPDAAGVFPDEAGYDPKMPQRVLPARGQS